MPKQQIHIFLEPTTYLKLKEKGVNMSELGNQLFSQYFESEEQDYPEEIELTKKITDLAKKIKELQEQLMTYSVMLTKIRNDKNMKEKDNFDKAIAMYDALKKSNEFKEGGW